MGMTLNRGDRVIATKDLGGVLSQFIRKGTQGVVVDKFGIWSSEYEVHFDGGATRRCDDREVARVNPSTRW
jgi:hypothetical protein